MASEVDKLTELLKNVKAKDIQCNHISYLLPGRSIEKAETAIGRFEYRWRISLVRPKSHLQYLNRAIGAPSIFTLLTLLSMRASCSLSNLFLIVINFFSDSIGVESS